MPGEVIELPVTPALARRARDLLQDDEKLTMFVTVDGGVNTVAKLSTDGTVWRAIFVGTLREVVTWLERRDFVERRSRGETEGPDAS